VAKVEVKCSFDKKVKLGELIPHPKNNNVHPKEQIERLAKIIEHQGMRAPIVVSNRSGYITKGHGRLMALKMLGVSSAPVNFQDYESEQQEYADLTADNEIARWAKLDLDSVMDNAHLLKDFDVDLLGIKDFDIPDLDDLIDEKVEREEKEQVRTEAFNEKEDVVPDVQKKVISKKGNVWLLPLLDGGFHRVMCGDSTKKEDVEKLMAGESADLVVTDPPYNVAYE